MDDDSTVRIKREAAGFECLVVQSAKQRPFAHFESHSLSASSNNVKMFSPTMKSAF